MPGGTNTAEEVEAVRMGGVGEKPAAGTKGETDREMGGETLHGSRETATDITRGLGFVTRENPGPAAL